jgi:Fur family ferric uptake transcriptional regulator
VQEDLHAAVAARLRRVGQRYTAGRRALIEAIVGADRPVTTAELMASRADLPQSTTYRNLAVLEQAGVVHRVRGADEFARFELTEELGGHHHHLVCVSCGAVEDFTPPSRFERGMADLVSKITTASGFHADTHRLDLLGTCAACGA